MQDHPPELKTFQKRAMMQALLLMIVPLSAWCVAFYRQEAFAAKDGLQDVLGWIFIMGVVSFMIFILVKALVLIPKCPECRRKMRELETIDITKRTVLNFKISSRWRIVECPHCNLRYRIPGLSNG